MSSSSKSTFKTVFIVPPTFGAAPVFKRNGITPVSDPGEADVIAFMGGADINPQIYGEDKHPSTYFTEDRDYRELQLYNAFAGKKPMIGICRGAQLLNCLAGGTLWQDVNNHGGTVHSVFEGDKLVGKVNSVHHQMLRPTEAGRVILAAKGQSTYRATVGETSYGPFDDPELVVYDEQRFYCWQGHPEFGHPETEKIFFEYLNRETSQWLSE